MTVANLIVMARELGATVVESAGAIVVVVPMRSNEDSLVRLDRAAQIAATSPRVVREAIRAGDLEAFGRQRDRSVRRVDLDSWIESRRAPVVHVDDDHASRVERRMSRRRREANEAAE